MDARKTFGTKTILLLACATMLLLPGLAFAHCDSLDGPVVNEARSALETGELTPVLKWVKSEHEATVEDAFAQARKVRDMGPEAKALADRFFFETVVRVHREGEGASYTGLKPAGQIPKPIGKADQSLAGGSVDKFADTLAAHVNQAVHERFDHALETRQKADKNVEAGREYVEAYVQYVHFIEGLAELVHGEHAH